MQCRRHRFSPWVGRSPGEGNDNPLQYCYLGNPMVRETWKATVHGVARVWHNLVTKQQPEKERCQQTGNFRLGMNCHILLRGEEQHLFWDLPLLAIMQLLISGIRNFLKEFSSFFCSYRISDECAWHFRVKA